MSTACDDQQTAVRTIVRTPRQKSADLLPGQILAGRYRVVDCIGSGGMGDVYRADDLKLGQKVALKRLAPHFRSSMRVNLLYQEIRAGREFAHPNLCRIHDLVESETDCFVSMEYIAGENLATLIRRIGRLPHPKGMEIARDLTSALAAIHARGMIHRDIKPSNVIIDEDGRSRLTDFGLAVAAADPASADQSGSPHYMAPEVLEGAPASARSDVYSLGLTLYEVFTGKRAHDGATLEAIKASQRLEVKPPSHLCPNIDPFLERTILWCTERDPQNRPADAGMLLRLLPFSDGGANDGGQLQSVPHAQVFQRSEAHLGIATTTLALAVAALLTVAGIYGRTGLHSGLARSHSYGRLTEQSAENLRALGFPTNAQSTSFWIAGSAPDARGPYLVYRQSPRGVTASNEWARWRLDDPQQPGTVTALIDKYGALKVLSVISEPGDLGRQPGVANLFEWAQLSPNEFVPDMPAALPPVPHDERRAWMNVDGDLRAEAAFVAGVPVYFEVMPGSRGSLLGHVEVVREPDLGFPPLLYMIVVTIGMILASLAARHNVVRGRGDRRAAFRLAAYVFVVTFLAWVALANHVVEFETEWTLLMRGIAIALLHAAAVWLIYLAIEPRVRARWPHMMTAWARLLLGRLSDPRVARDTLAGLTAGIVGRLVLMLDEIPWPGSLSPASPHVSGLLGLGAGTDALFVLLYYQFVAIFFSLGLLVLLIMIRRITPNDVAAMLVLCAIVSPMGVSGANVPIELLLSVARNGLLIVVLYRFGVHALAVAWLTYYVTLRMPLTLDYTAWYGQRSMLTLALLVGLALAAYRAWIGDRAWVARILSAPHPRS